MRLFADCITLDRLILKTRRRIIHRRKNRLSVSPRRSAAARAARARSVAAGSRVISTRNRSSRAAFASHFPRRGMTTESGRPRRVARARFNLPAATSRSGPTATATIPNEMAASRTRPAGDDEIAGRHIDSRPFSLNGQTGRGSHDAVMRQARPGSRLPYAGITQAKRPQRARGLARG